MDAYTVASNTAIVELCFLKDDYRQLEHALAALGIESDAAEYHGSVCGTVCAGTGVGDTLSQTASRERELLIRLRASCYEQLSDNGSSFMPLLPEDDASLPDRVEALALWCSGFLAGVSEAGARLRDAAPEVREIVQDMSEISRADLSSGAARDEDEQAYAELVEYVRVGAQIVFLELYPGGRAPRPVLH